MNRSIMPRTTDLSSLCPRHHTHATKYCPDIRAHLTRQREREDQARRDLAARFRGLQRCLTCNEYYNPRTDDHTHPSSEEEE